MQPEFWHQRWQDNAIGFHQSTPTPLLQKHWPALGVPEGARVFVPLCGKSLDMAWLAARGHPVLGVELSPLAIGQFFREHGLDPVVTPTPAGALHAAAGIEILQGDVFAMDPSLLATCTAVFDRAALIALPPGMRRRYARDVYGQLPRDCQGLLITLEYPQAERDGPPFSVPADEVEALFSPDWAVGLRESRPIPPEHPGFVRGVSQLDTAVFHLRRR